MECLWWCKRLASPIDLGRCGDAPARRLDGWIDARVRLQGLSFGSIGFRQGEWIEFRESRMEECSDEGGRSETADLLTLLRPRSSASLGVVAAVFVRMGQKPKEREHVAIPLPHLQEKTTRPRQHTAS